MPRLTNVENTLVMALRVKAKRLDDSTNGDTAPMKDLLVEMANVLAALVESGGPTWSECEQMRKSLRRSYVDWKAALAITVPLASALFGIFWKVIG